LGHGLKKTVTSGRIRAAVEALRPLYEARERKLRLLLGLEEAAQTPGISHAQQSLVVAVLEIMKQAGIDPAD